MSYQMTSYMFGLSNYSVWFNQGTCKELSFPWPQAPTLRRPLVLACFASVGILFQNSKHDALITKPLITLWLQSQVCLNFPQIMIFDRSCLNRKASLKVLILQNYRSSSPNTIQKPWNFIWLFSTEIHRMCLFPLCELFSQERTIKPTLTHKTSLHVLTNN